MRWFYEILYSRFRAPWDIGPRPELVELVESGRIQPCKAIDLGSGTASNVVYLAQHGFDVTGVDFAGAAIQLGKQRAADAEVSVSFIQDDLTHLQLITGTFDFLVDYGTLDDLRPAKRDLYMENVLPLTHPGCRFLLYTFETHLTRWNRPLYNGMALEIGEAEQRFQPYFEIEKIAAEERITGLPVGSSTYLMTRK